MRLLIISHTPHYYQGQAIVGWGPTVREIDYLSHLFDEVTHIAPLQHEIAPPIAASYQSHGIKIRLVSPTGGKTLLAKLSIFQQMPEYIRIIIDELRYADAVHVRCPATISLIALLILSVIYQPKIRWIKYAGSWVGRQGESWAYKFQRWYLRQPFHRGVVTVNGKWENQPPHIHSFANPCLTSMEVEEGRSVALVKHLTDPLRLLFVGRIDVQKGLRRVLTIVHEFRRQGVNMQLDVVGDGPDRAYTEQLARSLGLQDKVSFHGEWSRSQLGSIYAQAHLLLFPSETEGWPKVISEAMAYGVVPIASNVGSIEHYLSQFEVGKALDPYDIPAYVDAVLWYIQHPEIWKQEANKAVAAAPFFTYESYLKAIRQLLTDHKGLEAEGKNDLESNSALSSIVDPAQLK